MARHKSDVQDWMTANPITIAPDVTLQEAFERMLDHDVRRFPVVSDNELVGVITLSDIQRAVPLPENGEKSSIISASELAMVNRTVRAVMAATPITVEADDTVQDAAEAMLENQVSGLPVVSGMEVVGVITESDIFRLVVESWSPVMA